MFAPASVRITSLQELKSFAFNAWVVIDKWQIGYILYDDDTYRWCIDEDGKEKAYLTDKGFLRYQPEFAKALEYGKLECRAFTLTYEVIKKINETSQWN